MINYALGAFVTADLRGKIRARCSADSRPVSADALLTEMQQQAP